MFTGEELQHAAHELDERTYRQEFQARFENLGTGIVYYAFDREQDVRPLEYSERIGLFWSLDFNIDPMCSVIGQQLGYQKVYVLDELVLPNSNTQAACQAFLERTRPWIRKSHLPIELRIYGDATGNSRTSSASRTDWRIVRDFFKSHTALYQTTFSIGSSNPRVKDRVNCVNALLQNQAGERRLSIDPRCRHLILDLERVHWKEDGYGNPVPDIDKSDPARTHVSDALGYMIAAKFSMYGSSGPRAGILV